MRNNGPILILCLPVLVLAGITLTLAGKAICAYQSSGVDAGEYKHKGVASFMQMAGMAESATSKKPQSPEDTEHDQTDDVSVVSIDFRREEDGTEKLFIGLNRNYVPQTFALEGDKPRVVIDIKNVSIWKGKPKIPVNGKLIKQIRTYLRRPTKTLRLVLDLNLSMDYTVSPAFYPAGNVYCIEVRRK